MDVHEAIMSRHSCRRFKPDPVPMKSIRKILTGAGQAPSGHNTQPWKVYVVQGAAKQRITEKALVAAQGTSSLKASDPEFDYYPTEWFEPYLERRRATGFGLYGAIGIGRDDKESRSAQMLRNFKFFDAPVGFFITFSRRMSVGSFMDIGMFIQNILVGARGEGLHTCGQVAWCSHHHMIRQELNIDDDELLACGISVGYAVEEAPENIWRTDRADIDEWVTFYED
ncbi:MAG: nitroreductase [Pseudomonadota bacterium]